MGARSGGGGGMRNYGGYSSARAQYLAEKYLKDVKNPVLKKNLAEGMAVFDKEFGIPDNVTVTTKDLGENRYGQIFFISNRIEINSRYEDGRLDMGHAKHTMIHELAHSIDKTLDKTVNNPEYKAFYRKIDGAYMSFKANYGNKATKQIGSYALTNKSEFFADAVATHLTGTKNEYTTYAFNVAKSMTNK